MKVGDLVIHKTHPGIGIIIDSRIGNTCLWITCSWEDGRLLYFNKENLEVIHEK